EGRKLDGPSHLRNRACRAALRRGGRCQEARGPSVVGASAHCREITCLRYLLSDRGKSWIPEGSLPSKWRCVSTTARSAALQCPVAPRPANMKPSSFETATKSAIAARVS